MNLHIPYKIELAKTLSGHWYHVWKKGKPDKYIDVFPSSTTVLNAYPQSPQLTQWIAQQGWHESQRIKSEAGERGTRVHKAIEELMKGTTLDEMGFSLEEWYKINTFVKWYRDYNPEDVVGELELFSRKGKYAGRVDRVVKINNDLYVIDFKTSHSLHANFPLQLASYANAIEETMKLHIDYTAALQLGAKNKNGYRFAVYPRIEWLEHYKVFKSVKSTWEYDQNKPEGKSEVLELPTTLKL